MLTAIPRPRTEISHWAPRLLRTHIDPEKIGLLIGPGGKTIRSIQEATGAMIEVEDDGTVTIASDDAEGAKAGHEPRRGPDRLGRGRPDLRRPRHQRQGFRRVRRNPARQGRPVPHQRAGRRYVTSVADVCKVGDEMQVKVIAIDDQDRVKLSRKAGHAKEAASRKRPATANVRER